MHPDLLQQHHFLVVFADTAFDHLFDDVVGFAGLTGLVGQHGFLAFEGGWIDGIDVERLGAAGGDVHADLTAEGFQRGEFTRALDGGEHPDLAEAGLQRGVDVGGDDALLHGQYLGAADRHVLADGGDEVGELFRDGAAGAGKRFGIDGVEIIAGGQRDPRHRGDEVLEGFVARDEIGFGVDLDHRRLVGGGGDADQAFGGDAARLLGGGGKTLLAQPVNRGFDVAVSFGQRLLAVHHAGAGLVAQVFHQGGGDRSHVVLSWVSVFRRWRGRLRVRRRRAPRPGGLRGRRYRHRRRPSRR